MTTKRCVTCSVEKLFSNFHRSKVNADGLHKQCKECRKAEGAAAYVKHKDAIARRARERYAQDKEAVIHAARQYVLQNRDKTAERQAAYYRANKEQRRQYRRAHYEKNAERYMSAEACRRSLMRRLPGWADVSAIEDVYRQARLATQTTGVTHHVDHIVPLQGKGVCGLHVQNNLRVVPAAVNLSKKNRLEESLL